MNRVPDEFDYARRPGDADTIGAATERPLRAEALDDPLIWGSPDLADPEVRAAARR